MTKTVTANLQIVVVENEEIKNFLNLILSLPPNFYLFL